VQGKEGVLFYQIIHNRVLRRISTGHHIYNNEWCAEEEHIIIPKEKTPRQARPTISNDIASFSSDLSR